MTVAAVMLDRSRVLELRLESGKIILVRLGLRTMVVPFCPVSARPSAR